MVKRCSASWKLWEDFQVQQWQKLLLYLCLFWIHFINSTVFPLDLTGRLWYNVELCSLNCWGPTMPQPLPAYCLLRFLLAVSLKTFSKNSVRICKLCLFMSNTILQLDGGQCFQPSMWLVIETLHFHLCFRVDLKQSLVHNRDGTVVNFGDSQVLMTRLHDLWDWHTLQLVISVSCFVYFVL